MERTHKTQIGTQVHVWTEDRAARETASYPLHLYDTRLGDYR